MNDMQSLLYVYNRMAVISKLLFPTCIPMAYVRQKQKQVGGDH